MPISSKRPPLPLDNTDLYSLVFGSLSEEDGQRTAVIDLATNTETTYAELRVKVDAMAGWLSHKGITKGDVVALHCPNSEAFIIVAHAVWRIGAILSPLSLLSTVKSVETQLKDSNSKMLLTISALGDVSPEGARNHGLPEDMIIQLDTPEGLPAILTAGHQPPEVTFDVDTDVAALPYSSGTTGLPKGVQLSHRQLVSNALQGTDLPIVTGDDIILGILPFFHIYGLTALINFALSTRAKLLTMPKFDLQPFLEAHQKYGVTFTFIAPPVAVVLAKHPMVDNYDLSSLRGLFCGAASLDEELARAVEKRLGTHVQQGYGMTETSPLTHANIDPNLPRATIGQPVANTEHKLVNVETGEEIALPEGEGKSEVGELWVRGPQIMLGYLNRPEETAATLPGDGWLRTGDMAQQDQHGHVYIVDRLKELIKYKGYQVPPAELEALLLSHPAIADSAVVGVTREEDGEEIPKAYVVLQDGQDISGEEIMAFVEEHVAPYKKIRLVEFIDQIPKSSTGKILRRELRQAHEEAQQA
ncbi:4-coumarate--CoA ligase family protein [Corynebacterium sp. 320]|uniref:AMP-binding protein n=1 Tax=Corynebacterium TaxID=1716 RepID=UPI00125CD1FF|nr:MULTISPECIES: AMP-binding protein [Corynebacterium]KAB1501426.1 4-coumarate--CoA ligase family protein [Corynebacterium sp. 320]KAB1551450.1 4-coumarate--CoA ligase family protein [Corynebacterium sp. 321]KAB1551723.1 4-coumarate--CoA ligase family protein [Corynebacterium sp. 319]KAB3525784.1 4-coumarate--CoA ligase family protein [Corynebacterium sp. 250]KAB3538712.1 4-coumarate--CoA ligase family protein [Corynebacterium sp. 366]